jgi:hypothetical protein
MAYRNSRNGHLERIMSVSILLAQRPNDALVQSLGLDIALLGHLGDNRVHGFSLFVLFFALDDFLGRYSSFGKIDVSCGMGEIQKVERKVSRVSNDESLDKVTQRDDENSPLSGSTLMTTTTSFLPTRINFCTDRIRLRDNSDKRIIPSMLSYSSCIVGTSIDQDVRRSGKRRLEAVN